MSKSAHSDRSEHLLDRTSLTTQDDNLLHCLLQVNPAPSNDQSPSHQQQPQQQPKTMVPEECKKLMNPIPVIPKKSLGLAPPLPFFGRGTNKKQVFYIDSEDGQPPVPLRSDGSRKRVHPTKQQQDLLERFFEQNAKPNSKERAEICKAVNINSRSVQVWFQNRRVKAKKEPNQASHREEQEDGSTSSSSESPYSPYRRDSFPVAPSDSEPLSSTVSSLSLTGVQHNRIIENFELPDQYTNPSYTRQHLPTAPLTPITPSSSIPPSSFASAKRPSIANAPPAFGTLALTELRVGTWRRVSSAPMDLFCEISSIQGSLRWSLVNDGFQFRMEVPLSTISDASIAPHPSNPLLATVYLELCRPPVFGRELLMGDGGVGLGVKTGLFAQCGDFTEGQQATTVGTWAMEGSAGEMDAFFSILSRYFESLRAVVVGSNGF
ncbi:UNVERIFIED_CONTAM: hypothetical protein HDU68_010800 [Siphonaria sp. JEL0065]|nr:hypothetical protein HDU68_010800 [Siphonaria sp. JEL0065]